MRNLKLSIVSALTVLGMGVGLVTVPQPAAYAANCTSAADCAQDGLNASGGKANNTNIGAFIKDIVNILLYILGAVAVIMIVIGGIRYTISNGDSGAVSNAKNTILYAVIGLIIALMAYAIVNFVLTSFT